MDVVVNKKDLIKLLVDEIHAWESVGGGLNINAFTHDANTTDPKLLQELGYYDNKDSWIAGARVKLLRTYLDQIKNRTVL